jgi:hypothetical protein
MRFFPAVTLFNMIIRLSTSSFHKTDLFCFKLMVIKGIIRLLKCANYRLGKN